MYGKQSFYGTNIVNKMKTLFLKHHNVITSNLKCAQNFCKVGIIITKKKLLNTPMLM